MNWAAISRYLDRPMERSAAYRIAVECATSECRDDSAFNFFWLRSPPRWIKNASANYDQFGIVAKQQRRRTLLLINPAVAKNFKEGRE